MIKVFDGSSYHSCSFGWANVGSRVIINEHCAVSGTARSPFKSSKARIANFTQVKTSRKVIVLPVVRISWKMITFIADNLKF